MTAAPRVHHRLEARMVGPSRHCRLVLGRCPQAAAIWIHSLLGAWLEVQVWGTVPGEANTLRLMADRGAGEWNASCFLAVPDSVPCCLLGLAA